MSTDQSDADRASHEQVARTLLGMHFNEVPALVAGRVPDAWPPELIPSAPVSIVGGMTAGTSVTAIFRYAPSVERPVAEFCALLEQNGWTPARTMMSGGGFDSTRIAMFCHDAVLAHVLRASPDPTDTSIVVSLAPSQGWPCSDDTRMRMPRFGAIEIPRLKPPAAVRSDSGGGGGGGGDHTHRHIRMTTDLTAAELLPLYASQLADAGWAVGAAHVTPADATQWLEAADETGHTWRGLLTVYANGPGRDVFIYMAKTPT
jgi:hypothetical protein